MGRGSIVAGRAVIIVQLQDNIQKNLAGIKAAVQRAANSISSVGDSAMRGGFLGSIASGFLVKQFVQFEDAILTLQTKFGMFGRLVGQEKVVMDGVTKTIRELGRTTTYTSTEIAKAATILAQANLSPEEVKAALGPTLDLARATSTELDFAADSLVKTMKVFGIAANDMPQVASMFSEATRFGPLNLEDLMMSLRYSQGSAAALNQQLSVMLGLLAEMSNRGMQGSIAGTSLNTAMNQMAKKYKDIQSVVPGYSPQFNEQGVFDFVQSLNVLFKAMKGMPDLDQMALITDIFNLRGGRAAAASKNIAQIEKNIAAIGKATDQAARAAQTMDQGVGGSWRRFSSAFEEFGLRIGDIVANSLQGILETATQLVNVLGEVAVKHKALVATMVALPPLALAGGIGLIFMGKALATIASVLGVLRSGFNRVFGSFSEATSKQISWLMGMGGKVKLPSFKLPAMGLKERAVPAAVSRMDVAKITAFNKLQNIRSGNLMKAVELYWKQAGALKAISGRLTLVTRQYKQYQAVAAALARERAVLANLQRLSLVLPGVKLQMAPVIANIARLRSQLGQLSLRGPTGQFLSFTKVIGDMRLEQGKLIASMKALSGAAGGKFRSVFAKGLGSVGVEKGARGFFKTRNLPSLFPMLNPKSLDVKLVMKVTSVLGYLEKGFMKLGNAAKLFATASTATTSALVSMTLKGTIPNKTATLRLLSLWKQFGSELLKVNVKMPKLGMGRLFSFKAVLPDIKSATVYFSRLAGYVRSLRNAAKVGNIPKLLSPGRFLGAIGPMAKVGVIDNIVLGFKNLFSAFRLVATGGIKVFSVLTKIGRFAFSFSGLWTIAELLLLFGDKIPFVREVLEDFAKAFTASFSAISRIATYAAGPLALISAGFGAVGKGFMEQGVNAIIKGVTTLASIIKNQLIVAWNSFFVALGQTWIIIKGIGKSIWGVATALYNTISSVLGSIFSMLGAVNGMGKEGSGKQLQEGIYGWIKYLVTEGAVLVSDLVHGVALLVEKLTGALTTFIFGFRSMLEGILERIPMLGFSRQMVEFNQGGKKHRMSETDYDKSLADHYAKKRIAELNKAWALNNLKIRNAFNDTNPASKAEAMAAEESSYRLMHEAYYAIEKMNYDIALSMQRMAQQMEEQGRGPFMAQSQGGNIENIIRGALVGYGDAIIGNILKFGKTEEEKQTGLLEDIRDDQRKGLRQRGGVLLEE